ncbi:MAG TPA: hypothetical protein VL221_03210 [Bacteroidota bacterium]|nr:hypothetical protein [Bacteroidota bacterium]
MKTLSILLLAAAAALCSCHRSNEQTALNGRPYVFRQYSDGRPQATKRMTAHDTGVVLRHGDGPDSCDWYGAREAIAFEDSGIYYMHYDGAGPTGWLACLATSTDFVHWTRSGPALRLGTPESPDAKSASAPWVIREGDTWHMFYLGTPHTSPPPDRIPSFPYLTLKARARSPRGPWEKQYDVVPFAPTDSTYYTITASPGFIVKSGGGYLQFFSASIFDEHHNTMRTLGIARTNDLNGRWSPDPAPIVPLAEQIENSSLYFEPSNGTWFLFTNHIGIDDHGGEYADAIWVYWSKDLNTWNTRDKAIVLDGQNCTWAHGAVGMPSVVAAGRKLALLYDGCPGESTSHMGRDIGLAWLDLPLEPVSD